MDLIETHYFPVTWRTRRLVVSLLSVARELHLISAKQIYIELLCVSEKKISYLNKKYRGIASSTDVLSFEMQKNNFNQKYHQACHQTYLGSLVFCKPVIQKQALQYKHNAQAEFIILLVHGFLHLLGLDHEKSKAKALQMQKLEGLILRKLARSLNLSIKESLVSRNQIKKAKKGTSNERKIYTV